METGSGPDGPSKRVALQRSTKKKRKKNSEQSKQISFHRAMDFPTKEKQQKPLLANVAYRLYFVHRKERPRRGGGGRGGAEERLIFDELGRRARTRIRRAAFLWKSNSRCATVHTGTGSSETEVRKPWQKNGGVRGIRNVAVLLATANICCQKRQQRDSQTQLISRINCLRRNQFWGSTAPRFIVRATIKRANNSFGCLCGGTWDWPLDDST